MGIKTKNLYGISQKELHQLIGKAMINAEYNTRISLLKKQLHNIIEEKGVTDKLVDKISNAIDFWEDFKKDNKK